MINNKEKYNCGNVKGDAEIARESESKAIRIVDLAFKGKLEFKDLHDDPQSYHRGDFLMSYNGNKAYCDCKDDSMICKTGNVFAENYKYFKSKPNTKAKGWMNASKYDLVFVLDDVKDNIYILDFKKLKKIYERYPLRYSWLSDCKSYGNCVPLSECRKHGVLRFHIKYKENDDGSIEIESVVNCSKAAA